MRINPNLTNTYINKAFLYQKIDSTSKSCENFEKALENGITKYIGNMYKICDTNSIALKKFRYEILTEKSKDSTYGFKKENPIKVGGHGSKNQKAYLELLKDIKGNKIKYERLGQAGFYETPNGFFGQGVIDKYLIKFLDINESEKDTIFYITFYDYDPPKIPIGFYSK